MAVRVRTLTALTLIGFGSGLPYLLTQTTLQARLKDAGADITTIGFFSLVTLPYALKILAAPFIDRFAPRWLGRRRGWLLPLQLALIAAIVALGLVAPERLGAVAALAILVATLSALQDAVADAYRADVLSGHGEGPGVAWFVTGYRVALVVAGAIALWAAEAMPWSRIYALVALAMLVGVAGTALAREAGHAAPATLGEAVVQPLLALRARLGGGGLLLILAVAVLYKLGDAVAGRIVTPFLMELGYAKGAIGTVQTVVGMAATVVGGLLGGVVVARLGLVLALIACGVLQAVSNLGYWWLAVGPHVAGGGGWSDPATLRLAGVVAVENGCGGLGAVALVALLVRACDARFSATQFALFTSAMALAPPLVGALSGYGATHLGWPAFFLCSIVVAVPGLVLAPLVAARVRVPPPPSPPPAYPPPPPPPPMSPSPSPSPLADGDGYATRRTAAATVTDD